MRDKPFIDTNVFFYASDARDPKKQQLARDLIRSTAIRRDGVISTQVTMELAANLVKKLNLEPAEVGARLRILDSLECVPVTPELARSALRIYSELSISIWDAAIIAAAIQAKCRVVYTEDLQHGMTCEGVRIVNPFLSSS